jgi:hypothetical protein
MTDASFGGASCPSGVPYCTASSGVTTISPPTPSTVVALRDVSVSSNGDLHLRAGIYEFNTIKITGSAKLTVDTGPVIIRIKGDGDATPIVLEGDGIVNTSLDPTLLQFVYGGDQKIKITGSTDMSALIFAPNARIEMGGGGRWYGAILTNKVEATGGFDILYDRRLQRTIMTGGNPTMTSFTWRAF